MTTTYHVHLYREMRLFFPNIVAGTPEQAAERAAQLPDTDAAQIEDCEGVNLGALVDLAEDADYSRSVTVDFEAGKTLAKAGRLPARLPGIAFTLRTLRSALEEIDIGSPQKAKHLLEWAITELSATQEAI